jgi:tetratricopeptide (TPR) repeat protein
MNVEQRMNNLRMRERLTPRVCCALDLAILLLVSGCAVVPPPEYVLGGWAFPRARAKHYISESTAYCGKKDFNRAIEAAKQATIEDPTYGEAWFNLGWMYSHYSHDNQIDEAIQAYEKGIAIGHTGGPDDWSMVYYVEGCDQLGDIYCAQKKYDKAIRIYTTLTQNYPNDSSELKHLGNAYLGNDQMQEAIETYTKAAVINPDDTEVRNKLQKAKQRLQQERAPLQQQRAAELSREGHFQQIFKLSPDDDLTVSQVNDSIITWKNQHLDDLVQKSSAEDLRECADLIEHTIIQATAASEREKDEAQRLVAGGASGGDERTELAVAYRLRIEVLKPILAAIKEEIANRGK